MTDARTLLAKLALAMGPGGAELGGENVRMEQEPEQGLELRLTILDDEGQPRSVASVFSPRDDPPPAYPPGLLFLRASTVHVIEDGQRDVLLASWRPEAQGEDALVEALDRVVALSREAGWRLEEREPGRSARLVIQGRERRLELKRSPAGSVIALAERPV